MNPEVQQDIRAFHGQWLRDAITRESANLLQKKEDSLVKYLADHATDDTTSDVQIRRYAVQLQTIKTIQKLLYDTESFASKLGA